MKQLLLIGRPHVGKTTFLAQLYSQLASQRYNTSLGEPVSNLNAISDAMKNLASGQEVKATPVTNTGSIQLLVKNEANSVRVDIPDYGGEQINQIVLQRTFTEEWKSKIVDSDNWMLLIRPATVVSAKTLADEIRPKASLDDGRSAAAPYSIADQPFLVELLQIFRFLRNVDDHEICANINFSVVLTCWDELGTTKKPKDLMREKLPLLLDYIESTWDPSSLKIFGLSAQGFSLSEDSQKAEYKEKGAETFAYFIDPAGKRTQNLGELIFQAAQ